MGQLSGKIAVITAGTSGMALATAKLFEEEGAFVYITGRDQARLEAALQTLGPNAQGVRADSSEVADLDRLFARVKQEKGRIDVLFVSAGILEQEPLDKVTEESYDRQFGINTRGTLFTVQKALPLLVQNASIILNGSIGSIKGFPGMSVYGATKAALRSFARTWTAELKDRGIRTNVLSPGAIQTPSADRAFNEEQKEHLRSMVPKGRFGNGEEIASAVLFLATNDFVSGVELFVDGGLAQV